MAGVIQVNATVPDDVLPGAQVAGLTVGGIGNLAQQRVTVVVR
jgi:hypothetical protein